MKIETPAREPSPSAPHEAALFPPDQGFPQPVTASTTFPPDPEATGHRREDLTPREHAG